MSSIRQLGSGLLYAAVSVVLVVGGLSLALAEAHNNSMPAAKPSPTLLVSSSTATTVIPSSTSSPSVITPSPSSTVTPFATPQAPIVTATRSPATFTAQPRATSTRMISPTHFDCGPYRGWLRNYSVQPGDTLFHIATLYQTTVNALQIANCKLNFTIFPGEVLWVPNVPTITPGVTLIPTFATSTVMPTLPATPLPYYTETAVPTLPLTLTP